MLGDSELDQLKSFSNQYNEFKTLMSGVRPPNFSQFGDGDVDLNDLKDGLDDLLNPDKSGLNVDSLMKNVLGEFSSATSGLGSVNFSSQKRKIDENKLSGGIISKLIQLILTIVEIPMRFAYLSMGLVQGTAAFGIGIGGIMQSIALGTEDISILIFAILKIMFKYFLCIMSFLLTTIAGCLGIHMVTMFFVMLYLFIIYLLDSFNELTGIDLTPMVDKITDQVAWPEPIGTICYSCFGQKVQLREVIADVAVIEDIGNMISYDFNNTMPRYMNPAIPIGTSAMDSIDKAIN